MNNDRRLIEAAFPLKQASLDSVHEKNVRHGHISTLHIWPARRPLAACRAALIATLLPDPGTPEARKRLVERIGGTVVKKIERKKIGGKTVEVEREETVGGVLHWGRESNPEMDWFREQIRNAYNGRAPKVLDPFAGGGAIPLEAMRLGCDVTAIDINPVAWFILKCTLEYPQKLAGQKRPLPDFVLKDREFMEAFFKAQGLKGALLRTQIERLGLEESKEPMLAGFDPGDPLLQADLAWHVRAWGRWVLGQARRELAKYYPTYADFEPLVPSSRDFDRRDMRLVPLKEDGPADIEALNAEFTADYLGDQRNLRWIAKPTVAYLWARTVTCKNCRATIPLLKTRWLCKRDKKRVLVTIRANSGRSDLVFGIQTNVPAGGGNPAQRREHDREIGQGTMTRSGAWCPRCGRPDTISIRLEDIRTEGASGRLGAVVFATVVEGQAGKEYRSATAAELANIEIADEQIAEAFHDLPFGIPVEATPVGGGTGASRGFSIHPYGLTRWCDLYPRRQLLTLAKIGRQTRNVPLAAQSQGYPLEWSDTLWALLALVMDRYADSASSLTHWQPKGEFVVNTFQRFALPINWDFAEVALTSDSSGSYLSALNWVTLVVQHLVTAPYTAGTPLLGSAATRAPDTRFDVVLTDPPYYDSISYSELMDFFYVWLRRTTHGLSQSIDDAFASEHGPRWDHVSNDGELIDDETRHEGDRAESIRVYEEGMLRAFSRIRDSLADDGRMVVVFANKQPDAWERLVSAVVRAGFSVTGSWPIQTERAVRTRSLASAALSSSVWLTAKRRSEAARLGWDAGVLEEMRGNIYTRLREFWDAGIRGPDFVWAATGPALEAYSKHPIVKKANAPGETMSVSEFLRAVRRIVVDFVVGRVLTKGQDGNGVSGLDDVTTYYLLHRNDFDLGDAAAGACILYAVSCGLSDSALADQWDILVRVGGQQSSDDGDEEEDGNGEDEEGVADGTGSRLKLRPWHQRKRAAMGYDSEGRPAPFIDQVHRLMHLWKAGDQFKVDDYIEDRNLRKNALFHQILQALIELSRQGTEERSLLESLSNHLAARGAIPQAELPLPAEEAES